MGLVAKCGTRKVWHWAHKGRLHCDPWWENETEWHRAWKGFFPVDWQEVPARDEKGELHIADIRTPDGRVLEFQHSYIDPTEVAARTCFHNPMTWVVDGRRRKTDQHQFYKALQNAWIYRVSGEMVYEIHDVEFTRLVSEWAGLGQPVALDFGKAAEFTRGPGHEDSDDLFLLWSAKWRRHTNLLISSFGFFLPRDDFVRRIIDGVELPTVQFDGTTPSSVLLG